MVVRTVDAGGGAVALRRGRAVLLIAATILAAGLFARAPLADPVAGAAPPGASLHLSAGYLLLAPVCSFFDAISLLTEAQHLALLLFWMVSYAAWRILRGRRGRSPLRLLGGEAGAAAALLAVIGGAYLAAIFIPRPMASLEASDPDAVVVDFHSHTNFSHDVRAGFSAESNREWHRRAGFHAAYVTDHKYADTAVAAAARNPEFAGEGTVLLPGLEFFLGDQHIVALDTGDYRAAPLPGPVLIQTIPEDLHTVPLAGPDGRGGMSAIEIVDGAPRGLEQSYQDRDLILHIADSLNLALVASSNHHGWGWTSPAWNLMRIPGWRKMKPEELGEAISEKIRNGRASAVRVVERRRTHDPGTLLSSVLTGPRLVGHMLLTLTWGERLSWVIWIAGLHGAGVYWRRKTRR